MSVWSTWRDHRRWAKEIKDVPDHQLRGTVFPNPAKQRWAKRMLWRREKLWGQAISLTALGVSIIALIVSIAK